jgi:hypothetical protein
MSEYDTASDDELIESLRAVAARVDPVPRALAGTARAGFELAASTNWDAELARLTYDSLLDDQDLRAVRARGVRQLTFEGLHLTVELQVRAGRGDGPRELVGQLVPPQAARIEVRSTEGSIPVEAGTRGRFRFEAAQAGPMSLRCVGHDDAVTHTEWVVI